LIARLTRWNELTKRWFGGDDTLEILERIGEAGEPLAIPELMSFGFVQKSEVRSKARSVIQQLFSQMPVEDLPLPDEALRRSWGRLEDWYGMKADAVNELGGETAADRLYLALLTCHRSGYVRAEALRVVLATNSSDLIIPFALIRLVDWVNEVRLEAERAIRNKLRPRYAGRFVGCFGLLNRIKESSRFRPEYFRWIDELLILPECGVDLKLGTESRSREVRRHSYRIAAQNPALAGEDLVVRAIGDADVTVRKWAFTIGQRLGSPRDLMDRAATDPYSPIRRIAFEAEAEAGTSFEVLSRFLYDRSTAIRRECQSIISKRLGAAPAAYYRAAIRTAPNRSADICALGLAETGERSDAEAISALLRSSSARVRRATVRALRLLDAEGMNTTLLRVVSSDVPSVAKEAAFTVLIARAVTPGDLWGVALDNPDSRVQRSVLPLMKYARKWEQIQIYLQSVANPVLQDRAIELIALWLRNYNCTFVDATALESKTLTLLMEHAAERLPKGLARELDLILRTVGR
jgi:HEAT repeat protein